MEVKVAKLYSKAYVRKLEAAMKPHNYTLKAGIELPEEVGEAMMADVIAATILKDWKNIFDRDGKELPYSKEAAKKLLIDLPEFYRTIMNLANDVNNFKAAEEQVNKETIKKP
jgi:hypothetical protein